MTPPAPARPDLGPMPGVARMTVVDQAVVSAPLAGIFALARDVERWPSLLPHYRAVRFVERGAAGGVVRMEAVRPFWWGAWRTWWTSEMQVDEGAPWIRYRHIRGITQGMEVLWGFRADAERAATTVTILHMWNGPEWPLIGGMAARRVIGPVFVHGIASRTLAGLARIAEQSARF